MSTVPQSHSEHPHPFRTSALPYAVQPPRQPMDFHRYFGPPLAHVLDKGRKGAFRFNIYDEDFSNHWILFCLLHLRNSDFWVVGFQ
jgi:hypothetical protein